MEFNSFGPAVGRLGSDSSRGAKVEAGGLTPLAPLTLTTGYGVIGVTVTTSARRKTFVSKRHYLNSCLE